MVLSGVFCESDVWEICPILEVPSYVANMDSLCGLVIVSTASSLRAPVLRNFLQRYISYRVFLGVSMVCVSLSVMQSTLTLENLVIRLRIRIPHSLLHIA